MTSKRTNALSRAKKRRLKYVCELCRKRFDTEQAKWGHTPHCPNRNLSLQPATQAKAEATSSPFLDSGHRRPGPDSQEMKLLLLDTNEKITQLHSDAGDHAFWAQWIARTDPNHAEGHAKPEEWMMIHHDLADVTRDLDLMVGPLRLDRSILFNVYHRMLAVQRAWLECQRRDFTRGGELTPEGEEVLREEQALFADLILNIKRMLVAAR
jgi:hypothetical protein